jgi:hypothetical protein
MTNKEAEDQVWAQVKSNCDSSGRIDAGKFDELLAASLDDFTVPEGFDLIEELAKDLKFLHPDRTNAPRRS